MVSPNFTSLQDNVGSFPVCLEFPDPLFSCIFKDFFEDKCLDLKGMGLGFPVVVERNSLLIGGHPDGRTFSYFFCPV